MAFQAEAAEVLNLVQCELALRSEIVSLPSMPWVVNPGLLIDGHAALTSGSGSYERTFGPFSALMSEGHYGFPPVVSPAVLAEAAPLAWAITLAGISPLLPRFTLSAFSSAMLHEHAEALLMGWIVVEQLLDEMWATYVGSLGPAERRKRLKDTRTYTAAIQAEVLLTVGRLSPELSAVVQLARGHRNNVAHRAAVTEQQTREVTRATHAMLEFRLGEQLPPFGMSASGVGW